MAAYNPAPELVEAQMRSIRDQTHRNWHCVISDDCSSAGRGRGARPRGRRRPRFVVSRSPRRLGFYRNFERALTLAPAEAQLIALADQDDRWHPDKLATLVAELGDAQLVYSDARIVVPRRRGARRQLVGTRRNNHSDLLSLLVANSVTGAASLLRRELLVDALPFPPAQFAHFHDHWLALVALALGDIAYVDRPLYDYVQHGEASLGHAAANQMTSLRDRLRSARPLRERIRHVAAALLRRRLAAAAVRRDPRAAPAATGSRRQAARAAALRRRRRVAARSWPGWRRAEPGSWSPHGLRRSAPSGCWRTRSPGGGSSA